MGCGSSAPVVPLKRMFIPNNSIDGQEDHVQEEFRHIGIGIETINKLYILYQSIDNLNTGAVSLDRFYTYLRIDRSPFADRVLSLLDTTGTSTINFRNFVISMWNFCTMDNIALLKFAFTLFDPDNLETIQIDEFRTLVKEVYGTSLEHHTKINKLIEDAIFLTANDKNTGRITFESFRLLNQQFPHLMFPAFSLQSSLRNAILGEKFWLEQSTYRQTLDMHSTHAVQTILEHPHVAHPFHPQGQDTLTKINTPNETKEEKLQAEIDKLRSQRWMPSYMKPGEYVPTVARNSKAKAEARRKQLYGTKDITFGEHSGSHDREDNDEGEDDNDGGEGYTRNRGGGGSVGNYTLSQRSSGLGISKILNDRDGSNYYNEEEDNGDNDIHRNETSGSTVYTKRNSQTRKYSGTNGFGSPSSVISTESILKGTFSDNRLPSKGTTNDKKKNNATMNNATDNDNDDDDEDEEFENPYPRPRNSITNIANQPTTSQRSLASSSSFAGIPRPSSSTSRASITNTNNIAGSMEYIITRPGGGSQTYGSSHKATTLPPPHHHHHHRRPSNSSRRSSITGDDTSTDHHRHSITTGITTSRRISAVSGSLNPENIHNQNNRSRRKSSLANAQERAAAFAMMNV